MMWRTRWRRLRGYRPGRLGKNTIAGTVGLGARAILQAAYLLILSRWLGAEGYGLFAGSVALVILCAPLASWGSLMLITRHVALDRRNSRAVWATALVQTVLMGGLLAVGTLAVSMVLPQGLPAGPILLLAVSELVLLPITWAATSQCYALERGSASAVTMCLASACRLAAAVLIIWGGLPATPEHAALAHFLGSVAAVLAATALVALVDGWPQWRSRLRLWESMREGAPYAASNVAVSGYQEVDKILMLQSLGAAVVGPYTVAFRVVTIFLMPITALISASLPRLIPRAGTIEGKRTYRAVLAAGIGYGLLAGAGILLVAPWVPRLFGSDYALATHYVGLLALWPALFALRHVLAMHLTAHRRQSARSYVELAGFGVVVSLNLLLLPGVGAEAAVFALLVSELFVAGVMGWLVRNGPSPGGRS